MPFVGAGIAGLWGLPDTCNESFRDSAADLAKAHADVVAHLAEIQEGVQEILDDFKQIFSQDAGAEPTGILPTTLNLLLAPSLHTAVYIGICLGGIFLVLVGVIFTM